MVQCDFPGCLKSTRTNYRAFIIFLEIIGPFSHRERSPGILRSPYGGAIWEQGKDAVLAPAVGILPAQVLDL